MSELCKECFIKIWEIGNDEIENIVESNDDVYICEGCGEIKPYVVEMR